MPDAVAGPARPIATPEEEAKIREFNAVEEEVRTLEEQLKDARARLKYIGESEMVEVIDAERVATGVTLSDGTEWLFERKYYCGVKSEDKRVAHEWLEEHNAATLLKHRIVISFPKNSADAVAAVRSMIARVLPEYEVGIRVGKAPLKLVDAVREIVTTAKLSPEIEVETELPGATLSAFVRKSMAAGTKLPECFNVYAPLRAFQAPLPIPGTENTPDYTPEMGDVPGGYGKQPK